MKYDEIMDQLATAGTAQTVKIYKNHGADLDLFGVSMKDLKKIVKPHKNDHDLGMKLLQSSNVDAIYMAQWMVDSSKLTIGDLEAVLKRTTYYMLIDNCVASIASSYEPLARQCLSTWLHHKNHYFRQAAYTLYALMVNKYDMDTAHIQETLDHVHNVIHKEANRVRYSMNSFLIAVGGYIPEFTSTAKEYAKDIGKVSVYMGKTSCKVPDAFSYIEKMEKRYHHKR